MYILFNLYNICVRACFSFVLLLGNYYYGISSVWRCFLSLYLSSASTSYMWAVLLLRFLSVDAYFLFLFLLFEFFGSKHTHTHIFRFDGKMKSVAWDWAELRTHKKMWVEIFYDACIQSSCVYDMYTSGKNKWKTYHIYSESEVESKENKWRKRPSNEMRQASCCTQVLKCHAIEIEWMFQGNR